jgi:hypothetical protein
MPPLAPVMSATRPASGSGFFVEPRVWPVCEAVDVFIGYHSRFFMWALANRAACRQVSYIATTHPGEKLLATHIENARILR